MSLPKLTVVCAISIGCLAAFVPKAAQGGLMLSLQGAGTVDLANLYVGQEFTVEVLLSGLQSADELNYLGGTVTFDSALLGTPSSITAGAIVPDLAGFTGFGITGLADGNYDVLFAAMPDQRIATNGALYSFRVTAQQAGAGLIELDISSLAARDTLDTEVPVDIGLSLAYTINGDPNVVPEPASWLVFVGIGCLSSGLFRRARTLIAT